MEGAAWQQSNLQKWALSIKGTEINHICRKKPVIKLIRKYKLHNFIFEGFNAHNLIWSLQPSFTICQQGCCLHIYSSNQITKKELKSDNGLSKFDWYDLSQIFLSRMLKSHYITQTFRICCRAAQAHILAHFFFCLLVI